MAKDIIKFYLDMVAPEFYFLSLSAFTQIQGKQLGPQWGLLSKRGIRKKSQFSTISYNNGYYGTQVCDLFVSVLMTLKDGMRAA